MDISGTAKSPNLSFRYNANNEELEELFDICEDDPPTTQVETSASVKSDNASPKKTEKSPSIIDKYFKSIRSEKSADKLEDVKGKDVESKLSEEGRTPPKDVTLSPVKEYLNRLSKKSTSEVEAKEGGNETWKIFHDFKFKITQAVEDIKTRSGDDTKEKSVPRDNSVSDSEENSVVKDLDISVGDTDNQVSSLDSSIQNLSEISQPLTAKATELETSIRDSSRHNSESSDDTHRNIVHSYAADLTGQYLADSNALEVESGVEALEDNVDAFGDLSGFDPRNPNDSPRAPPNPKSSPQNCSNFGIPPNDKDDNNAPLVSAMKRKSYFLTFTMYFLTILLVFTFILFPNWNVWNGFLLGIWFYYVISNLKQYIMETYFGEWEPYQQIHAQVDRSSHFPIYTIPTVQEHQPVKKYEGWINHYRASSYDPYSYHINQTTTAFMKLEGVNLRISYTQTKIPKRALWNEELEKVVFYQHRLYNLTGARVILLPRGLVRRRHWSKKYPICIILQDNEKIQVLEKESLAAERRASEGIPEKRRDSHESEGTETSTPEKKKKFVWRRKERSVSNSEETSNKDSNKDSNKEGLRQRLVRKMHRDKKPDSVSTGTDVPESPSPPERPAERPLDDTFHDAEGETPPSSPGHRGEEDDEIDETEMSKIREFLEETELEMGETAEGEWSLHVKYSDKNTHLYIFTRTGRDKHEWYRRLNNAVLEGTTPDSTDSEELSPENMKEAVETTVYKVSEQNVAFRPEVARSFPGLHHESIQEGVNFSIDRTYAMERNVESLFWPYIFKVIQNHEIMTKQTKEAAVMCEIEPSALNRSKSKKKKKDAKTPPSTCDCRMLPLEVTWLNTLVARLMYDIMRDPLMNARLHTRIQKKLHTLKLPSFMSPLVVTQLSLTGACPMVERVSPPTWDERGVWLDADLRYDGGAYITILTQINLLKLKEKNVTLEERLMSAAAGGITMDFGSHTAFSEHVRKPRIAACDSEMEDSAESSEDDESPPLQPVDSSEKLPAASEARLSQDATSGSSKKKFLRMVDKIATNKYFQQVTDYKYVKRAMEGLSNTDIKLQIEVHGLEGRLAFNLPPPPHDRIWFGFRTNPQLILKARPAVGQRALRFSHISNWIEQKLTKEFEKVMVLPNMEDILIDVMTPTPIEFD